VSRQLQQKQEEALARRNKQILLSIEGGLSDALARAGAVLLGFSVKHGDLDCLITLRVELAGRRQIAYVGSSTLGDCLVKAMREARSDKLRWKDDRFCANGS
jgi:hypothetical protein